MTYSYFDRDLSWLSFNERILMEAARAAVPIGERLNFLSIFSSNLDEFYRVRMPAILALGENNREGSANLSAGAEGAVHPESTLLSKVTEFIDCLQTQYGQLLTKELIPLMEQQQVYFLYRQEIPDFVKSQATAYFYERVAAFIRAVWIDFPPDVEMHPGTFTVESEDETLKQKDSRTARGKSVDKTSHKSKQKAAFFPQDEQIYLAVFFRESQRMLILNIPSGDCPRFYDVKRGEATYVIMLDDIVKQQLPVFFSGTLKSVQIEGCYSFKMSRDATVDYRDDYRQDQADFIEKQINKRAFGLASRLLYDSAMPNECLTRLLRVLNCASAILVKGGSYHNLKDLTRFPVRKPDWFYKSWPRGSYDFGPQKPQQSIFDLIALKDRLISPPYHNYNAVLRFFNEAAIDPGVEEVAVTLYRIAGDSQIAHALISAAKNGKKVTVFVELKARFDEANNVKWAKKMKAAGVRIIYSIWALKVHAKVALVKHRRGERTAYYGIFATGNFNENTAAFYGDHILMTAQKEMLAELEVLLLFLEKRTRPDQYQFYQPQLLLVAGFNLLDTLLSQIDRCIQAARTGQPAALTIKLNNLEEKRLIDKLYEASAAGVQIDLIIRSICRLIPGKPGMSENIRVRRLVDRYLEHSRVYIFKAADKQSVFLGSADWMNRNIYRRIEVCFPILDPAIMEEVKKLIDLQLADNVQAVKIGTCLENERLQPASEDEGHHQAQWETWQYLNG